MKKIVAVFILSFVGAGIANSQGAKSAYFELGGPGLASFNFDSRFSKKQDGFGGRVGIGGFSLRTTVSNGSGTSTEHATVLFIPVGLNYLLGKDHKNYFEIGGGVTPVIASASFADNNFTTTFGYLNFGYRMQPKENGFTFRASICPVFGSFGFIPYYGGVSFGYKFGSEKRKEE